MAAKAAKNLLRKEIKRRVSTLSEDERLRQSRIVAEKLFRTAQWQTSKRISIFLSMHDEIRTDGILRHAFEGKKHCFIPRYIGPKMDMVRLASMEDFESLPETSWKIKQPPEDEDRENALDTGGLDLILMPGLGFSLQGDRLGRGKGYYDTYLQKCKDRLGRIPDTIAVAFNEQICDNIPTTELDIPVDVVLFENGVTPS